MKKTANSVLEKLEKRYYTGAIYYLCLSAGLFASWIPVDFVLERKYFPEFSFPPAKTEYGGDDGKNRFHACIHG